MRLVYSYLLALAAFLVMLLYYARDYLASWLQPDGAIVQNLIPSVLTMMAETTVIVIVLALVTDRKWIPLRKEINDILRYDYSMVIKGLDNLGPKANAQNDDNARMVWQSMKAHIALNDARQRMQYLTPAFSPELAQGVSRYMEARRSVEEALVEIADHDIGADLQKALSVPVSALQPAKTSGEYAAYWVLNTLLLLIVASHKDFGGWEPVAEKRVLSRLQAMRPFLAGTMRRTADS